MTSKKHPIQNESIQVAAELREHCEDCDDETLSEVPQLRREEEGEDARLGDEECEACFAWRGPPRPRGLVEFRRRGTPRDAFLLLLLLLLKTRQSAAVCGT